MDKLNFKLRYLLFSKDNKADETVAELLSDACENVRLVDHEEAFLTELVEQQPNVVLLALPETEMQAALIRIKGRNAGSPVICLARRFSTPFVVEAIRSGAFDCLILKTESKAGLKTLAKGIKRASKAARLWQLIHPYPTSKRSTEDAGILGTSAVMRQLEGKIRQVAKTEATVLILGKSGTGKELVSRAIHQFSGRPDKHFEVINCAAIPSDLLENELFGSEKGAFTGSTARHIGACERAHTGTLFLDEICEMRLDLQTKILRFIQERRIRRIGGSEGQPLDVRIIAATNRDPLEEVKAGRFREDLYYRLSVVPLQLAPLAERKEDIPVLANHFLKLFSERYGKYFCEFTPESMRKLTEHSWPGNIRELQNAIEYIVVLHDGADVLPDMLPVFHSSSITLNSTGSSHLGISDEKKPEQASETDHELAIEPLETTEKRQIQRALDVCNGKARAAANMLEISPATLYRKIQRYELEQSKI